MPRATSPSLSLLSNAQSQTRQQRVPSPLTVKVPAAKEAPTPRLTLLTFSLADIKASFSVSRMSHGAQHLLSDASLIQARFEAESVRVTILLLKEKTAAAMDGHVVGVGSVGVGVGGGSGTVSQQDRGGVIRPIAAVSNTSHASGYVTVGGGGGGVGAIATAAQKKEEKKVVGKVLSGVSGDDDSSDSNSDSEEDEEVGKVLSGRSALADYYKSVANEPPSKKTASTTTVAKTASSKVGEGATGAGVISPLPLPRKPQGPSVSEPQPLSNITANPSVLMTNPGAHTAETCWCCCC